MNIILKKMLNKKTKILVTSSYGFVGYNLTKTLLNKGYNVRGNRFENDFLKHSHKNFQETNYNLLNKEDCEKMVEDIDIVYMCAAVTSGAHIIVNDPLTHVTSNVIMLINLLEASKRKNVKRFVFLSTGCVYPNIPKDYFSEEDMLMGQPFDVYYSAGWTKRYSEILCRIFSKESSSNLSCLIVRPSNIYGPFDKFDKIKSHVTASVIRKVYEGDNPIMIWGNGEQLRDLIYVDDFVDAMIEVSKKDFDFLEINIASGNLYSVNDIIRIAMVSKKSDSKIIYDANKPQTVDRIAFNIDKIKNLINFSCKFSIEEGIKKTFDWIEKNKDIAFKR